MLAAPSSPSRKEASRASVAWTARLVLTRPSQSCVASGPPSLRHASTLRTMEGVSDPPRTSASRRPTPGGRTSGATAVSHRAPSVTHACTSAGDGATSDASTPARHPGDSRTYACDPYAAADTSKPEPTLPCARVWHSCARLWARVRPAVASGGAVPSACGSAAAPRWRRRAPARLDTSAAEEPIPVLTTVAPPPSAAGHGAKRGREAAPVGVGGSPAARRASSCE
mmetsp:Transcript_18380/g.28127  ORF Transcript_18380/g.28127 Transcript_18380/m.28127 type:complete len:226 (-) Transcript_18380:117-794(-)